MARIYDDIDLAWTLQGDLNIGPDGDIADTASDVLRSIRQEIRTRVRSSLQDWELHPGLGADLDEIIGEPNSRETATVGRDRIVASLTRDGFMADSDIQVKSVPVDRHTILYRIRVSVASTTANGSSEELTEKFLFFIKNKGFRFIT